MAVYSLNLTHFLVWVNWAAVSRVVSSPWLSKPRIPGFKYASSGTSTTLVRHVQKKCVSSSLTWDNLGEEDTPGDLKITWVKVCACGTDFRAVVISWASVSVVTVAPPVTAFDLVGWGLAGRFWYRISRTFWRFPGPKNADFRRF